MQGYIELSKHNFIRSLSHRAHPLQGVKRGNHLPKTCPGLHHCAAKWLHWTNPWFDSGCFFCGHAYHVINTRDWCQGLKLTKERTKYMIQIVSYFPSTSGGFGNMCRWNPIMLVDTLLWVWNCILPSSKCSVPWSVSMRFVISQENINLLSRNKKTNKARVIPAPQQFYLILTGRELTLFSGDTLTWYCELLMLAQRFLSTNAWMLQFKEHAIWPITLFSTSVTQASLQHSVIHCFCPINCNATVSWELVSRVQQNISDFFRWQHPQLSTSYREGLLLGLKFPSMKSCTAVWPWLGLFHSTSSA